MLLMERSGECLYKSLESKAKNPRRKPVYEKLALNEQETAQYIEKEIASLYQPIACTFGRVRLKAVRGVFALLTERQLLWLLKKVLAQRNYKKWYDKHKDKNQDFWNALLKHEDVQFSLLGEAGG